MIPAKFKSGILLSLVFLLFILIAPARPSEPVSITVLTLDNRPPNNLFLKQLAAIAGIDIEIGFNPSLASSSDLVSLNAAAAGSLVGSRRIDPGYISPPRVRPDALLHFAVPRAQPTVTDQTLLSEYNETIGTLANPDIQRDIISAIRGNSPLPENSILSGYITRMQGWLDYIARGNYNPDRLLITLDDNRPGPLSDGLKLLFGEYSHYVYDGTDEGMMLLLARALRELQTSQGAPSTACIVFTDPADLVQVQPLESGIMIENLLGMTDWLGLRISPDSSLYEPWRPVLWIHGVATQTENYSEMIRTTSRNLGNNPVIVADVARVNGGDPVLIDEWKNNGTPDGLCGYLAWNTCSNTLGSAVALWTVIDFAYYHTSDPEGVRAATETFLWARFLDDYIYQALVRSDVIAAVRAENIDPYQLPDSEIDHLTADISSRIVDSWLEMGESLAIPLRFVSPLDSSSFIVELPWNRLFEIELFITDDRAILPVINPLPEQE